MRARYPDSDGIVVRDGVGIRYERYGQGWPAVLLLPAWSLVPSRHWKMQVPYLARHFTVVCFDGRGSGGSGRPAGASAYSDAAFAADALAVMDAAGIDRAVLVSLSRGALWALRLCAEHPHRVLGSVFISPTALLVPPLAERRVQRFEEVMDHPVGWQTYNAHYWKTHYPEFVGLDRYGAGQHMDYATTDPDLIAANIAELAGKPVSYRDVETDGAARAAQLIAELI